MKIAAVVITFNRLSLLKDSINGLRSQTRALDAIYVINNSSTDGTEEWLNQQADLNVIKQENLGNSAGQYTGMKAAYDAGFDFIWSMDDDVVPHKDCLEKLSKALKENEASFVAPLVWGVRKQKNELYHAKRIKNYFLFFIHDTAEDWLEPESASLPDQNLFSINACGFVGPLFKREYLSIGGFPRKGFFILLDDLEFTYRLSKERKGFLIKNAVVDHYDIPEFSDDGILNKKLYWKMYYYVRNRLHFTRINNGYIITFCTGLFQIFAYTFRHCIRYRTETFGLYLLRMKGIWDGILCKEGKNINPGQTTI